MPFSKAFKAMRIIPFVRLLILSREFFSKGSFSCSCCDIKKFVCTTCSRSYKLKRDLQRHLKQCGKLPLLKCQYCEKSFFRKDHLTNHIGLKHSKLSFPF
ncbi:unnamed protein product [Nezara viridula]|uniref:C2H2-type domain-containing protein n=1 Tax=Nezara viridula TaxID=85310 RepID=A0A9P0HCK6_NEZVI|nr:unnamed protein product [Nezara viridula]